MTVPLPANIGNVSNYQIGQQATRFQYQPQVPILAQPLVAAIPVALTYPGYEPPQTTFFEKKAVQNVEAESSLANEFEVMKKMMSQLSNKLTRVKLSQGQNQNYQRPTQYQGSNFVQNQNKGYNSYNNNGGSNQATQDKPPWVPRENQQWNTCPNNGSVPVDNVKPTNFADTNFVGTSGDPHKNQEYYYYDENYHQNHHS